MLSLSLLFHSPFNTSREKKNYKKIKQIIARRKSAMRTVAPHSVLFFNWGALNWRLRRDLRDEKWSFHFVSSSWRREAVWFLAMEMNWKKMNQVGRKWNSSRYGKEGKWFVSRKSMRMSSSVSVAGDARNSSLCIDSNKTVTAAKTARLTKTKTTMFLLHPNTLTDDDRQHNWCDLALSLLLRPVNQGRRK